MNKHSHELRSVPGLESATISGDIPLVGFSRYLYARGDRDVPPVEKREIVPGHEIAPGYFKTWGVPLLAGRDFNEHDTADAQKVCLISQAGAKKVYPGENPIGKSLLLDRRAVGNYRNRRRCALSASGRSAGDGTLSALGTT